MDLEAEIVVITNDVPLGVNADDALRHIVLLGLVNDVTLRNVVLPELARASASCKASRPRRCRRCWSRPTSCNRTGAAASCTGPCRSG